MTVLVKQRCCGGVVRMLHHLTVAGEDCHCQMKVMALALAPPLTCRTEPSAVAAVFCCHCSSWNSAS